MLLTLMFMGAATAWGKEDGVRVWLVGGVPVSVSVSREDENYSGKGD